MSHQSSLIASDIHAYLQQHQNKELLRMLTCGSVDDGKSTLIGRLLHDSKMIYEDQLSAIRNDSKKHGTTADIDLALLVDGLQAEREQGITIDVAYRYFSTEKRKFIIADTPGHEQYTRNMATGASNCDLAVILIDARYGVVTQTRRHSYIASLLGIRHIIVAINKMDLVDYAQSVFDAIKMNYTAFAMSLGLSDIYFVPISALKGDNVVHRSQHTPWYTEQPLMEILETVKISADRNFADFRFPVQYVNRPNLNFRGFCGTITAGEIRPGDTVQVLPAGTQSKIKQIVTYDGELKRAFAGQAVTLTLTDEIDISRGDVLIKPAQPAQIARQLSANLIWMAAEPMVTQKNYLFKFATKTTSGQFNAIDYQIDVNTQQHSPADSLPLNGIAQVQVNLAQAIAVEPYKKNTGLGAFIVIDRINNLTVGAGMVTTVTGLESAKLTEGDIVAKLYALLDSKPDQASLATQLKQLVQQHFPD